MAPHGHPTSRDFKSYSNWILHSPGETSVDLIDHYGHINRKNMIEITYESLEIQATISPKRTERTIIHTKGRLRVYMPSVYETLS